MRIPLTITAVLLLLLTAPFTSLQWANEPPVKTPPPYDQKKARSHYVLCASCHGSNGEGNQLIQAPAIGGMPKWYVARQLHKFKYRIRAYHPKDIAGHRMGPMARTLKDEDFELIAQYM